MKRQPSISRPIAFRHRFVCCVWVLICAVLFPTSWILAQADLSSPPRPQMLLPVEAARISSLRLRPGHVRHLRLNPELGSRSGEWLRPGQEIRLDLLERQDVTVAIESVDSTATGGQVIRGRATSDEASSVTLTLEGRSLTGFIRLEGLGAFRLAPQGAEDLLEVIRVDTRSHAFCGTVPQPVPGASDVSSFARAGVALSAQDLPPADTLPDPTVVDVMFLYTPQAVIGEGNEQAIRRRILESVEETNHRLTNSLIHVRMNPVYVGLYNTFETGDLPRDTYRLASGVDGMERVPVLRNDYKADLVCLITELENQGIGGLAWDLTPPQGNPATGFMVIRRPLLGKGFMVLPHEFGHLLGCDHDREHAAHAGDDEYYAGRKPYIFGHRFEVEGVTYIDTMSYDPGIYVPYYGNPRLSLDGVPLGVPAESARPSDGARTINETAPYVARYRTALSRIEFAEARVIASEQSGSATVRVVRAGDLNSSTRVNVVLDPTSSAKAAVDYTRPSSVVINFATNQAAAEIVIPILADELVEGEESVRLSLISALGEHGIGLVRTCELVILDASTPAAYSRVEFPDEPLAVLESAEEAIIRVASTGPAVGEDPAIPYRTADGSAVAGLDYQAVSGTLALGGGSVGEIRIPLMNRPEAGPDRTFSLIVGTRTNVVRILDEQRVGALTANPGRDLVPDGFLSARVRGDGKILVWGNFSRLNGRDRTGIALLNADGTVDDGFRPPEILLGHRKVPGLTAGVESPGSNASITTVRDQPDGKLILAGAFSRAAGRPRTAMMRLNPDGSMDDQFGEILRFDGAVSDLAVQPDGRILVGGTFEHVNGVRRPYLVRLLQDGTVDGSFRPSGAPISNWMVLATLALQSDERILIGGIFGNVEGTPILHLARLNPDGTLDSTFKVKNGAAGPVWRIRVQPDDRIVVGGVFDSVDGRMTRKLARLNADGSDDVTFRPPNPNADVNGLVCLPDGRLLVSGNFTTIAGKERRFLTLLNPDGTLDTGFDLGTGPDGFLGGGGATSLLADGTLYLSGPFQRFNGLLAPHLVRLNLGPLTPRLQGAKLTDGDLQVTVHGLPGGIYPIQSSNDLKDWQPAGEVRFEGYQTEARLTATTATPGRFFRLQSPAP